MDRAYSQVNSIMEQAASLIRRKKEATRTFGPTESLSKGGENEVYTGNEDIVVKLNNFEYTGDTLWNRWRFVFY